MNESTLDRRDWHDWPASVRVPTWRKPASPPLLPTSSIYMAWCHHAMQRSLTAAELREQWPQVKASQLNAHLFMNQRDPLVQRYTQLHKCVADELTVPPGRLARMFGWDLTPGIWVTLTLGQLRWCPECMRTGYHSSLFQHQTISHCPLHRIALCTACPKCRAVIAVTVKNMTEHPFACPGCEELLVDTAVDCGDWAEHSAVDQMLESRYMGVAATSVLIANGRAGLPRVDWVLSEHQYRIARRGSICAARPAGEIQWEFPTFRTEVFLLEATAAEAASRMPLHLWMVVDLLRWLWRSFPKHCSFTLRLIERLGPDPKGARIRARVPILSAAIYQMLIAYGLARTFYREFLDHPEDAFRVPAYAQLTSEVRSLCGAPPATDREGTCALLMEMIGFVAIAVVRCRSKKRSLGVCWVDFGDPAAFAVVPLASAGSDRFELRTRGNESALARLSRRVAGDWLEGDDRLMGDVGLTPASAVDLVRVPGVVRLGEGRQ